MFEISDKQIEVYQEGIDAIIEQLGKKVLLIGKPKEIICPNCYYDGRRKRSSGRRNPNNPNPLGSALNIFFEDGTVCPVCRGRGKLTDSQNTKEIKATVKWNPRDYTENSSDTGGVVLPDGICKIKTYSIYTNDIKNSHEILVTYDEPVEGSPNFAKCILKRAIAPRGLKSNRYIEAYLELVQEKTS